MAKFIPKEKEIQFTGLSNKELTEFYLKNQKRTLLEIKRVDKGDAIFEGYFYYRNKSGCVIKCMVFIRLPHEVFAQYAEMRYAHEGTFVDFLSVEQIGTTDGYSYVHAINDPPKEEEIEKKRKSTNNRGKKLSL